MAEKSFLLVSLEEQKARKLANVIGSDTCRKILDYLAKRESTETDLSTSLAIPISTVHYNLKQLVDAGLVHAKEFHYSQKGREVNHYSLANKYIVIAPSAGGIPARLKRLLPVVLGLGAVSVVLQLLGNVQSQSLYAARTLAEEAAPQKALSVSAQAAPAAAPSFQSIGLWFFLGGMAALFLYVLWSWVVERK